MGIFDLILYGGSGCSIALLVFALLYGNEIKDAIRKINGKK